MPTSLKLTNRFETGSVINDSETSYADGSEQKQTNEHKRNSKKEKNIKSRCYFFIEFLERRSRRRRIKKKKKEAEAIDRPPWQLQFAWLSLFWSLLDYPATDWPRMWSNFTANISWRWCHNNPAPSTDLTIGNPIGAHNS